MMDVSGVMESHTGAGAGSSMGGMAGAESAAGTSMNPAEHLQARAQHAMTRAPDASVVVRESASGGVRKVGSGLLLGAAGSEEDGGAAGVIAGHTGPPQKLLNVAVLSKVLEQAVSNGVKNAALLMLDGSLLCVAGDTPVQSIVGTLVSNIWMGYDEDAHSCLGASNFYFMVVNCELGKLGVARINRFLLCLIADDSVPIGLLKFKITALVEHLKPLKNIYDVPEENA